MKNMESKSLIVTSEKFRNFLEQNKSGRIARLMLNIIEKADTMPAYRLLVSGEMNYLSIRDSGNISFLPKGKKLEYNEDGKWSRKNRQEISPGRFARKFFTISFSDSEVEQFANAVKAFASAVSLRVEDNVEEIYNETVPDTGTLGNSCMKGKGLLMKLYEDNGIKVLTARSGGELVGRALLWPVTINGEQTYFCDRIYVAEDHIYKLFLEYCEKEKYYRKANYNSNDPESAWVDWSGKELHIDYKFVLKYPVSSYGCVPYIDTFRYSDDKNLYNNKRRKNFITLDCTDGGYTDTRLECCGCGALAHQDDMVRINGDGYCADCVIWDNYGEQYIRRVDAVRLHDGYWTHMDYAVRLHDGSWANESDAVEINGRYYHRDDSSIVYLDYINKYALIEDTEVCAYDGERCLRKDAIYIEEDDVWVYKGNLEMYKNEVKHEQQ
jgi:hypothetical protein